MSRGRRAGRLRPEKALAGGMRRWSWGGPVMADLSAPPIARKQSATTLVQATTEFGE